MTELYQVRPEHDDPAENEPAADHDHGDAGTQATLDREDQLPTRQDARAATWDEDPEYDDSETLAAEYDGDLDALTADDQLPTRQNARDATWDDNPDYYDENEPGTQDDADPGGLASEDHDLDGDQGDLDHAAGSQATSATARPDALPAESSERPAVPPGEGDERSPAGTSERITGLETENARLGQTIADLQARLERLEQGGQAEPSPRLTGQERDTAQQGTFKAESPQEQRRHRPTDEALALGAAATGGMLTTVADYVPYLHADVAGIAASAVAVGAAAITWIRAKREAGHANRPED